jgi:hypothetical protein
MVNELSFVGTKGKSELTNFAARAWQVLSTLLLHLSGDVIALRYFSVCSGERADAAQ